MKISYVPFLVLPIYTLPLISLFSANIDIIIFHENYHVWVVSPSLRLFEQTDPEVLVLIFGGILVPLFTSYISVPLLHGGRLPPEILRLLIAFVFVIAFSYIVRGMTHSHLKLLLQASSYGSGENSHLKDSLNSFIGSNLYVSNSLTYITFLLGLKNFSPSSP